jgi:hypothetical protein
MSGYLPDILIIRHRRKKRPQNFVVSEADFCFYFVLFTKKAVDKCL